MIRLSNTEGQTLNITPGTRDLVPFLAVHLGPHGVTVEHVEDPPGKYGLTSSRRFPAEPDDRPPMSPLGEELYGQFTTLYADGLTPLRGRGPRG